MHSIVKLLSVTAFTVLAVASLPHAAFAATVDCPIFATLTNTTNAPQNTTSQTFVNIPGTAVSFNAQGNCAIVTVSAEVRAQDPRAVRMRIVLDEDATITPTFVDLYTLHNTSDVRSSTFVLRNFPEGDRTLRVQFLSKNGASVSVLKVITTIHYNTDL